MRIYPQQASPQAKQLFEARMGSLQGYNLIDIMIALAQYHGGTTPLYEAVERATEEIDEAEA